MTRWYRAYEGTVTDPKLGEAALLADCSRAITIATWHALLESAACSNDAGRFTTTARRIAVILCEPPALITSVLDAFSELGLITAGAVTAWSRRQYESDSSTERSRRSRAKKKDGNDDATLQRRCATPPETEAETDNSEADASGAAAPPAPPEHPAPPKAIDVRAAIFGSGVPMLTAAGKSDREARSMLGRWRKDYTDGAVLDALSAAEAERPSEPIAWITRTLESRNGNRAQRRMDSEPDLRGRRPDPSLDLLRAARRAEEAECSPGDWPDHRGARLALPSVGAG